MRQRGPASPTRRPASSRVPRGTLVARTHARWGGDADPHAASQAPLPWPPPGPAWLSSEAGKARRGHGRDISAYKESPGAGLQATGRSSCRVSPRVEAARLEVATRVTHRQGGAAGRFSQGTGGRRAATAGAAGWHQYGLWHMAFGTGDHGIGG